MSEQNTEPKEDTNKPKRPMLLRLLFSYLDTLLRDHSFFGVFYVCFVKQPYLWKTDTFSKDPEKYTMPRRVIMLITAITLTFLVFFFYNIFPFNIAPQRCQISNECYTSCSSTYSSSKKYTTRGSSDTFNPCDIIIDTPGPSKSFLFNDVAWDILQHNDRTSFYAFLYPKSQGFTEDQLVNWNNCLTSKYNVCFKYCSSYASGNYPQGTLISSPKYCYDGNFQNEKISANFTVDDVMWCGQSPWFFDDFLCKTLLAFLVWILKQLTTVVVALPLKYFLKYSYKCCYKRKCCSEGSTGAWARFIERFDYWVVSIVGCNLVSLTVIVFLLPLGAYQGSTNMGERYGDLMVRTLDDVWKALLVLYFVTEPLVSTILWVILQLVIGGCCKLCCECNKSFSKLRDNEK